MGHSIAITSGKGGTGKSVLTSNLSVVLSEAGKNVLILDADLKMANLSLLLDLEYPEVTLSEVLAGEATIEDAVYEKYGVKIVPAGMSLSQVRKARADRLEEVFATLTQNIDYLLIDTSPGLEADAISALAGAESTLLIITPEVASITDAFKIKKVCDLLNTTLLGLVVNRVKYEVSELSINEIETVMESRCLGVIPEDPEVQRSVAFGKLFCTRTPNSAASKAMCKLGKTLLGKRIEESTTPYERLRKILG